MIAKFVKAKDLRTGGPKPQIDKIFIQLGQCPKQSNIELVGSEKIFFLTPTNLPWSDRNHEEIYDKREME